MSEPVQLTDLNRTLTPSKQAVNLLKSEPPRLLDLRQLRWPAPARRPRWQRTILSELRSIFQVFKLAERAEDITPESLPVGHVDNPYGSVLIPLCSGSYKGRSKAITASHCLRSKRTPVEELHIFRFYQFEIRNQHLEIRHFRDFRITLGSVERNGDLAQVMLNPVPTAEIHPVILGTTRNRPEDMMALGFPSSLLAHPFVSLDCRVSSEECREDEICFSQCPTQGGMSGGPVVRRNRGSRGYQEQWGIVSLSDDDGTLRSPRINSPN